MQFEGKSYNEIELRRNPKLELDYIIAPPRMAFYMKYSTKIYNIYLKYFSELAKIQHYGKAAKALNISQPGLSHAIKSLEEEYGVPLFQKEGRNVSLSHYGKELMKDVDEILGAYLRLEERAVGLRTEEKTVRIGSVYPLAPGTIPHMLKEFGATFPFIIYNRMTPEIAEGLLDGKYDIGFCSDLLKSDEIEYYPIRDSYIAVVVPKGQPNFFVRVEFII